MGRGCFASSLLAPQPPHLCPGCAPRAGTSWTGHPRVRGSAAASTYSQPHAPTLHAPGTRRCPGSRSGPPPPPPAPVHGEAAGGKRCGTGGQLPPLRRRAPGSLPGVLLPPGASHGSSHASAPVGARVAPSRGVTEAATRAVPAAPPARGQRRRRGAAEGKAPAAVAPGGASLRGSAGPGLWLERLLKLSETLTSVLFLFKNFRLDSRQTLRSLEHRSLSPREGQQDATPTERSGAGRCQRGGRSAAGGGGCRGSRGSALRQRRTAHRAAPASLRSALPHSRTVPGVWVGSRRGCAGGGGRWRHPDPPPARSRGPGPGPRGPSGLKTLKPCALPRQTISRRFLRKPTARWKYSLARLGFDGLAPPLCCRCEIRGTDPRVTTDGAPEGAACQRRGAAQLEPGLADPRVPQGLAG